MSAATRSRDKERTRPARVKDKSRHGPARRVMRLWAWRLFRREWRQQVLVLGLIIVAVAATILGAAVATSTPSQRVASVFGTADEMVGFSGGDHHLTAAIAAIQHKFGPVDVIENQTLRTGSAQSVQLRAQNPRGPYGGPTLALMSGRYPAGPDQVAVTSQVATLFNLHVGGVWRQGGQVRRVVGVVENPSNLLDEFALVAPGQLRAPTQVTVLFNGIPEVVSRYHFPPGSVPQQEPFPTGGLSPSTVVLVLATLGMIFIGLLTVAGFTVLGQRRLRALGMLSSLGATDRDIRRVMITYGAIVGLVGTLLGGALGLAGWFAYEPHLEVSTGHRIDPFSLPWGAIVTAMILAVVTAVLAARRPARALARLPVMTALAGRPARPRRARRTAIPGILLLAAGVGSVGYAGPQSNTNVQPYLIVLGIAALTMGGLLLAPLAISAVTSLGARAPLAIRLALRDLSRYRARSGSALGAITFAVLIAVMIGLASSARYANPVDYFQPNLPGNQLVVYAPGDGPSCCNAPVSGGLGPAALQARARAVARALHSHDVLPLDTASGPLIQSAGDTGTGVGEAYVATPGLLRHYGISPGQISPRAVLVTSRPGLSGAPRLQLPLGNQFGSGCPPRTCVSDPVIQTLSALPTDASDPNLVLTTRAVRRLGLREIQAAWLIQTGQPLTAGQINDARQIVASAGMTIETKNDNPSLAQLRNYATAGGVLLALGVLAMTVGLIRGETAGDLRTLTATGASSGTRRSLVAATAGTLGLTGALLGSVVAYLGCGAFYRTQLSVLADHVPVLDLVVIIIGMPLVAAAGGWLLAGRQPPVIARQPIE